MRRPCRRCRATMPETRWRSPASTARSSRARSRTFCEQRRRFPGVAGRLCRPVRDRDRGPRLPPRRDARARMCAFSVRSKRASSASIAWCSARWSTASGRRRRAATRGCRGRCGSRSGSICRSGASACRRTTSRNCSGTREVILSRAAKLGGAPTVASRFTQRLAAVAGETHWKRRARARRKISRLGARSRPRRSRRHRRSVRVRCRRSTRARTRLSVTRDRGLLRDPYTIYARAYPASSRPLDAVDTPPGARDRGTVIHGAIGDFTEKYAEALPADPLGALLAARRRAFRARCRIIRKRARSGGRASCASRAGSSPGRRQRRADATALHAEVSASLPIAIGTRTFTLRDARRPHRAARATAATRSSTTRPARRRPSGRCAPGSRRSSRWKARSCARAASRTSPRRIDQRVRLCGAARRRAGGRAPADRVQGRHAGRACRQGAREAARGIVTRFATRRHAVSLAGQPDVEDALRRLRPSGAHQGMVAPAARTRKVE